MVYSLLINTSKPEAWVAVVRDGEITAERSWKAEPDLGVVVLQTIDVLLSEAGLELSNIDRIGVHRGPGHFSALRTGIMTADTLARQMEAELVELDGDEREVLIEQVMAKMPVTAVTPQYE